MAPKVGLMRLGTVPYGQALALQFALRARLRSGEELSPGFVICLEHPATVTLGKRGKTSHLVRPDWLRDQRVEVYRVDRGGEATYHGPGQLVIYPVLKLERIGMGVVDLIRGLAGCLADALEDEGIASAYDPDHPGLWTTGSSPRVKVASVGMRVQGGVTTHGAAINLINDMRPFSMIVPCGIPDAPMASVADLTGSKVDVGAFRERLLDAFSAFLGLALDPVEMPLPPRRDWAAPIDLDA